MRWLVLFCCFQFIVYRGAAENNEFIKVNQKENPDSTNNLQNRRTCTAIRINLPPEIDGRLNDSCWAIGKWEGNFTQYKPYHNEKPSFPTYSKVLYDDKYVYVAIRACDDMSKVSKRLGRRDNFSGDIVGIDFDSYFDRRSSYEFNLSAAGQKLDVWLSNDGWDVNWNAVWDGDVAYEDTAWTAEFRIPLSQLRYSSAEEQVWGFNVWRLIERFQEEDDLNVLPNDGTGVVYSFGNLTGLNGLKKSRRIELLPYVSGKFATSEKIPGNPFAKGYDVNGQIGLDTKIGLSNNFTLDATINPDFGQVEADPSVMNLSAFETYFEEKRPFFIEGRNIFEFNFDNEPLFYTRRIGHAPSFVPKYDTINNPEFSTIASAFKLSGKTSGGLSIGIIESITLKENAEIFSKGVKSNQAVEPLTNYFIGRFQQDINHGNTIIGGIITQTHREINDYQLNFLSRNALTGGVDFTQYWKGRKYFLDIKTIGSSINGSKESIQFLQNSSARYLQRPELIKSYYDTTLSNLNGFGASLKIGKYSKGHWRFNEELAIRTPGLELNDLGFMNLSNVIKNKTNLTYDVREKLWFMKYHVFTFSQQNAMNNQGKGIYSLLTLGAESELLNNWYILLNEQYKFRNSDEWILRGGPAMKLPNVLTISLTIKTDPAKDIYLSFSGNFSKSFSGNSYNYNLNGEFGLRPLSNLNFSILPSYYKGIDELQYVNQFVNADNSKTYLLGTIDNRNLSFTLKVDFALSPELIIQYYGSPFVSIGKYYNFKEVTNPTESDYNKRFKIVEPIKNGLIYSFDNDHNGVSDYTINSPDFNFHQFKSNLVVRWEYKTGSTFYFVWAQGRTAFDAGGNFSFSDGYTNLFDLYPNNIFMIKFNYWFSN